MLLKVPGEELRKHSLSRRFWTHVFDGTRYRKLCARERVGTVFHSMDMFWKYCRKRLKSLISIVLSNSMVWKYSRNTPEIFWKSNLHTVEEVYCTKDIFTRLMFCRLLRHKMIINPLVLDSCLGEWLRDSVCLWTGPSAHWPWRSVWSRLTSVERGPQCHLLVVLQSEHPTHDC